MVKLSVAILFYPELFMNHRHNNQTKKVFGRGFTRITWGFYRTEGVSAAR
jgi:hypothetical protein